MRTDYKFWYIKRDDNGLITEAAIRFYEGNYDGEGKYIRTKRLETFADLEHLAKAGVIKGITEKTGKKAIFYTQSDFGQIKTDDELRLFLNKEITKDPVRVPIDGQKEIK